MANITNIIDGDGFHSKVDDGTPDGTLKIPTAVSESAADSDSGGSVLTTDNDGTVVPHTLAERTRFSFYRHSEDQDSTFDGDFTQLFIDGGGEEIQRGLNLWDTSLSVFRPEKLNNIYTLAVQLEVEDVAGNPTLDIELVTSGVDPTNLNNFVNRRAHEFEMKTGNNAKHQLYAIYPIFTTQKMLDSGSIIMVSASNSVTITSASILVKEG